MTEAMDAAQFPPMFGASAAELTARPDPCHRCGQSAAVQWPRYGTDDEREQHWAAVEQHIRSIPDLYGGQNDSYTADRNQPVTKAVFGCNEHQVADMAMLHASDCGGHGACGCGGSDG